ncbi:MULTISPECIES: hypothetical protein [Mycobacteriaceae]|uniref:hypothetical protein n=1 Tax=Mycobacteriaceae TaxID=1762 RepID=UPI0007FE5AEE|nr:MULTISPECIES: hypothetical protein [Mycobacteriaceae]MCK0176313.1 hypothetical protein [Mycolicibacterium sp. F2034L]OBB61666.1 hypothetical protein A5757_06195 [Mycobacterium sp. 852013-51886_SCH5428379]
MKLVAVLALAAGAAAAPLLAPTGASAAPPPGGACDGAQCVPYVHRNIDPGAECVSQGRWQFGLDASGNTYTCSASRAWVPQPPLVGVRLLRQPCGEATGVAQTPDGLPLSCKDGGWSVDYTKYFFS